MTNKREPNSCVCKCGSISCRKIHVHSFPNQIPQNNDQFLYSKLHHKSFCVYNSNSIVIDKCCGNYLLFHCSKCHEKFSIIQSLTSKPRYILGFNSDCLTYIDHFEYSKIVIIPDFPIALRSFVFLSKQQTNNVNSHQINKSIQNYSIDTNSELLSAEFDEDIMFGKDQPNLIIGKYNEVSISSFVQNYSTY